MLKPTKRICIAIASEHFIYRGLGSYARSIIDWAHTQDYVVDIVSDLPPRDNQLYTQYESRVQWISPDAPVAYSTWKELTMFKGVHHTERQLNFHYALLKALRKHRYDLFISNGTEILMAMLGLDIHNMAPLVHPTHRIAEADVTVKNDFILNGIMDMSRALLQTPGVIVATQSDVLKNEALTFLSHKAQEVITIPMSLPERELLNFTTTTNRQGIGYIGPYSTDKNSADYIALLEETKLPAVVLTPSKNSAATFRKEFEARGIPYEIHVGVTGKEKVDIIRHMGAGFSGSHIETFGLGVYEMSHAVPVVLYEENRWSRAHKDWAHIVPRSGAAAKILELYQQEITHEQQQALLAHDARMHHELTQLLNPPKNSKRYKNNLIAQIEEFGIREQGEWADTLPSHPIDEIQKTQRIADSDQYEVLHTRDHTYYRLAGTDTQPQEPQVTEDPLFTFG